jgi:hypothetical protein
VALAFGVAYAQYALFYHTQNQYFFQGLVGVGFGLLQDDWLARTPDPWPVFTYLVEFTYRFLDQRFFYLYFVALCAVYAFSVMGIVSLVLRVDSPRLKYLVFATVFVALHSPLFGYASRVALGLPMASSPHHFNVGRILLLEGIGEKRILGDMLNPGTFGAFLMLSIYLFLRRRPFLAVASSTVAAIIQPSYVMFAGLLTLSYMLIMIRRGEGLTRPVGLGAFALVLILPLLVYSSVTFRSTDPAIWQQAQDTLWRVAYFPPSIPSLWLGDTAYMKAGLVLWALYLIRSTELFWIVLLSFAVTGGLTGLHTLWYSTILAALLPWRISAVLVPLSTSILLGFGINRLWERYGAGLRRRQRLIAAISVLAVVAMVIAGMVETKWRFDTAEAQRPGVMRFVKATKAPGQTYLIPPDWREFRLFTGAPAFAERSVIPYNDTGIMEWARRIRIVNSFYGADNHDEDYRYQSPERRSRAPDASLASAPPLTSDERCGLLKELSTAHGVTHVVFAGDLGGCSRLTLVFSDGTYRLYAVKG